MKQSSKKRNIFTTAIAVILAAVMLIGGSTFAYLQANSDDVINDFKTNLVSVDLKESTDGKYNIIPGTEEFKDPTVTVNSTISAYVYVEVADKTDNLITYEIADGWNKLEGFDNVYYRETDSSDNEHFTVLENNMVSYDTSIVNSDMLVQNEDGTYSLKQGITLSFNASAIQKEPFDSALDAYTALTNKTPHFSVSEIARAVFGYNAESPLCFAYLGTDNTRSTNNAYNYDTYLLPLSALGLQTGDTLICKSTNQSWDSGYLYNLNFFDENMQSLSKSSDWVASDRAQKSVTITDDMKYFDFRVIFGGYGKNVDFDKSTIPLEDFILYRNSTDDDSQIDYISVWNDMLVFDNSLKLTQEVFGHNVEWDYTITPNCSNTLDYRMKYYDTYDIDLLKTSDGVYLAAHDKKYNFDTMTLADVREQYPDIMTFEEVLEYAKKNNKLIYVSRTNNEIRALIEKHQMQDKVLWQAAFDITSADGKTNNGYNGILWSCIGSDCFDEDNILKWKKLYGNAAICSGGYGVTEYYTDSQIDWCIENNIDVGAAFFGGVTTDYRCNSRSVTAPLSFFRTHNQDVLDKIDFFMLDNEKYSEALIKAAYRYAYVY